MEFIEAHLKDHPGVDSLLSGLCIANCFISPFDEEVPMTRTVHSGQIISHPVTQ